MLSKLNNSKRVKSYVVESESTLWVKATELTTNHMLVERDGYLWNVVGIKDLGNKLELSLRNDFSMINSRPKQIVAKNCQVLCMIPEQSFQLYNSDFIDPKYDDNK